MVLSFKKNFLVFNLVFTHKAFKVGQSLVAWVRKQSTAPLPSMPWVYAQASLHKPLKEASVLPLCSTVPRLQGAPLSFSSNALPAVSRSHQLMQWHLTQKSLPLFPWAHLRLVPDILKNVRRHVSSALAAAPLTPLLILLVAFWKKR